MIENDYFFDFGEHKFQRDQVAGIIAPGGAPDEEQHRQTVMRLLAGEGEDNAGPYWLRFIVEGDAWCVPLKPDGTFELLNTRKGEHDRLVAGVSKRDGRRSVRQGAGGQMLPVYLAGAAKEDDRKFRTMDGRSLARSLPAGISGLLLQVDDSGVLRELSADFFDSLARLADAAEIEDALMTPGKIDIAGLKEYLFQAAAYKGALWCHNDVAVIGTHSDSIQIDNDEVELENLRGDEILERVRKTESLCGILINPGHAIGRRGKDIRGLLLSLNFIARARRESQTLATRVPDPTVRSLEEFELWLKQVFFPAPFEILEKTDDRGRVFIQAINKQAEAAWSFYECEHTIRDGGAVTPFFQLVRSPGSADEIAAGQSSVLCPGLLARSLYRQLPEKDRASNLFRPGLWLGVARILKDDEIELSRLRVRLASELLKLIPAGAAEIPRESILSVEGARFLAWAPFAGKRSWVEKAREQAGRFRTRIVFGP